MVDYNLLIGAHTKCRGSVLAPVWGSLEPPGLSRWGFQSCAYSQSLSCEVLAKSSMLESVRT